MLRKRAKFPNYKERIKNALPIYGKIYGKILKRDGFECALCGDFKFPIVHHLDGDKTHNTEDNLLTVCKRCHSELHGYTSDINEIKKIVEMRNNNMTYQEIADCFNLTRQRIEQILKKSSKRGFNVRPGTLEKKCLECGNIFMSKSMNQLCQRCRHKMRFRKKTKRYFNCVVCGKKVDKKVEGYGLRIFCREHADIFYKDGRDPRVRLKCDFCKKEFHPFRNYKYFNSKRFFCSHQCYTQKLKAEKLDKVCYTINMYKRKIILLDEKQEEQLRKLAFVNRTSQAKIIRDALAFYISNPPKGEKNV